MIGSRREAVVDWSNTAHIRVVLSGNEVLYWAVTSDAFPAIKELGISCRCSKGVRGVTRRKNNLWSLEERAVRAFIVKRVELWFGLFDFWKSGASHVAER